MFEWGGGGAVPTEEVPLLVKTDSHRDFNVECPEFDAGSLCFRVFSQSLRSNTGIFIVQYAMGEDDRANSFYNRLFLRMMQTY